MLYITLRGRWCDITLLNVHPHLRIKMMLPRIAFTKN